MNDLNFSRIGINELKKEQAKNIYGGSWQYKYGGWIGVATGEIVDVITSGGENLKEAYQNGREAARQLLTYLSKIEFKIKQTHYE